MASAYLNKSFSTATSQKIGTISFWFKISNFSNDGNFLSTYENDNNRTILKLNSSSQLEFQARSGGNVDLRFDTNRKFRDTSAWYHLVIATDTTQSTAGDRVKIYVNGVQETSFATSTIPNQNVQPHYLYNNMTKVIGAYANGPANYFDGQMAHFHMTDGTAYQASTFGETDATTGIWKPKVSPSVTYGNNGFFLKFDNSANMGLDSSGQSNNFTTNGTIIQTKDTPSNVFASLNAIDAAGQTLSNINLTGYNASSRCATSTLGFSKGKYYWECKVVTQNAYTMIVGIMNDSNMGVLANLASNANGWGYVLQSNQDGGKSFHNNSTSSVLQSVSQGDIIQIAVDSDAGKIWFGVNGTYVSSGNPATGANAVFTNVSTDKTLIPAYTAYNGSGGNPSLSFNFGNGFFGTTVVTSAQNPDDGIGIFEYDPPAGYRALCTKSINAQEYS